MDSIQYRGYTQLLQKELVPALGCTEPISIAYAAAALKRALGTMPRTVSAACSGNIIKNVQGVIVPGTGSLRGIRASVIMGLLCGDLELKMEVLSNCAPEHVEAAKSMLALDYCSVSVLESDEPLHIILTGSSGADTAVAEVKGGHTDLIRLERNGKPLLHLNADKNADEQAQDKLDLSTQSILEFASSYQIDDLKGLLDQQINYNLAIAEEGLKGGYGAAVGASLLRSRGNDLRTRACAYPAAGSDARMSGCMLPVVINSGSGNQGMTVSLPVIVYAREMHATEEQLYRALAVSNLMALQQKQYIGKLSAFCGAVCASCGAGAGIAYLRGASLQQIDTVVMNTLATVSGMVCDGAKASCAGKIASSVNAAIMAVDLAMDGRSFQPATGILGRCEAETVENIGRMANEGMRKTDAVIQELMIKNDMEGV